MLLAIYLNDHLAGATGGRELARRAAANNRSSDHGEFLAALAVEIDEDRNSLIELMGALDVNLDRVKVIGGWAAEKVGRLKLNGHWFSYSPLSRLLELEGLALGVRGKLALWRTLQKIEAKEPRLATANLLELILRAEDQFTQLEEHRLLAATEALSPTLK